MKLPQRDAYLGGAFCIAIGLVAGLVWAIAILPQPKTATSIPKKNHVVVASGDIACPADKSTTTFSCRQADTAKLVTAINPEAVLALGDLQYTLGALADFQTSYDKSWGAFKDKTYPVPGNHDYGTLNGAGYHQYFGKRAGKPGKGYYSFMIGSWKIIALNTEVDVGAGSEQVKWLESELSHDSQACTLAFWHRSRFSSGEHGNDPREDVFWQTLYKHNADLILSGHSHNYERFIPQDPEGNYDPEHGIVQIVAGMGGYSAQEMEDPLPNAVTRQNHAFGVLKLNLYKGGAAYRFMSIPGFQTFDDSGIIRCH